MTRLQAGILVPLADTDFGHMGNWGAGWWILMGIGMVIFWGLVAVGIVWVVRELAGHRPAAHQASALEVLDRRFAAGEISAEEYAERRRILSREPPTGGG